MALEEEGSFPEYYEASAYTYLLSHSLTDSKALKRLRKQYEAALNPESKQVLSSMIGHPAYWSFFSVEEIHDDDFFTIEDLLSGETHQLYSARLSDLASDPLIRDKHFLSLVYSNGECLQVAGVLRFNSLSASDFRFYCSLFHHKGAASLDEATLKGVINRNYLEFFKLDSISLVSEHIQGDETLKQMWQPFTLQEFDIKALGGVWGSVAVDNQIKYTFTEPDEAMGLAHGGLLFSDYLKMECFIVRDKKTGAMGLSASTDIAYAFQAALLNHTYPNLSLPDKPSVSISTPLAMLLMDMDIEVPWSHLKKSIFTPSETAKKLLNGLKSEQEQLLAQQEEEELEDLLYIQYKQAQADNIHFDIEAFCKQTGATREKVDSFILEMTPYTVPPEDKPYELTDFPVPPQAIQKFFHTSLVASELFQFDEGPNTLNAFNALTGDQYKDDFSTEGLPSFLEKLFVEYFTNETISLFLANYCFWILFHKGKEWLAVRSYAIEILKQIPSFILLHYEDPESFIADFSLFTKKFLSTRGICSLSERPKAAEVKTGFYLIKGSDAFYSLVEGVDAR